MALAKAGPGGWSRVGVLVVLFAATLAAIWLIGSASRRSQQASAAPASDEPASAEPSGPAPPRRAAELSPPQQRPVTPVSPAPRPATSPNQAKIAGVVADGRDGIEACYQRALARDPSLVFGRVTAAVSVAASGRVTSVKFEGPAELRPVRPCLEKTISGWRFPTAPEAYKAELPLVLEGAQ
jgi:hypothetical protein